MDSVQISDQNKLLYAGTAATPNYIPPEYYIAPNKDEKQNSSWDDFALGVIFYQVLIGLHPYVVTPCNLAENATNEIYSNITKYLFPFGENKIKFRDTLQYIITLRIYQRKFRNCL